ncbi:MAG TPA: hypothetical protein VGO80_06800, partial [Solirubrobacteraceae bacterium]|nr:hypothetical protein [Solirubrobacteraceae bacterium]
DARHRVRQGFENVLSCDLRLVVEIGDRPGDADDAVLVAAVNVPGRHGVRQRGLRRRIAHQHSRAGRGHESVEDVVAAAGALAVPASSSE